MIIQSPGGTAAKSSNTYKVSLPSSWVKERGITDNDRQVELCFDGTAITISKRLGLEDFKRLAETFTSLLLEHSNIETDTPFYFTRPILYEKTTCSRKRAYLLQQ